MKIECDRLLEAFIFVPAVTLKQKYKW